MSCFFSENSDVEIAKVNNFYLFAIMIAKRCNRNKDIIATAYDEYCKHYFHMRELKQSVDDSDRSVSARAEGMCSHQGTTR